MTRREQRGSPWHGDIPLKTAQAIATVSHSDEHIVFSDTVKHSSADNCSLVLSPNVW